MTPNAIAGCLVAGYAAVWLLIVALQCRRSDGGWRAYLLYCIHRTYIGLGYRLRTNGRCPFPAEGAAIIIANHKSPVDPLYLWQNNHLRPEGRGRFRIISFLMASEYYEIHPLVAFICRAMRSIPVARNGRDMGPVREAMRALRRGELVGVFPEGGINLGDGLRPATTGVAWLALTSEAPVIPVFIHNAPDGGSMVTPFHTFQQVRLTYGTPLDLSEFYGRRKTRDVLEAATLRIMGALGALGGVDMQGYRCAAEPINGNNNGANNGTNNGE